MEPNIESGLEVREDARQFPEAYIPEAQKEATAREYPNGSLPGGQYYDPHTSSAQYNGQDIKDEHSHAPPPQKDQRICGLTPALFGFTTALITALIVGAAIGGGLGGALADAKNHASATTTITITSPASTAPSSSQTTTNGRLLNYTAAPAANISSVYLPCPSVDGNTYTTINGQTWAVSCSVDEYTGDIGSILAYTYQDCIEACAAMNTWQHKDDACSRVQYSALMANHTGNGDFGNCWLKNDTAYTISAGSGDLSAKLTS